MLACLGTSRYVIACASGKIQALWNGEGHKGGDHLFIQPFHKSSEPRATWVHRLQAGRLHDGGVGPAHQGAWGGEIAWETPPTRSFSLAWETRVIGAHIKDAVRWSRKIGHYQLVLNWGKLKDHKMLADYWGSGAKQLQGLDVVSTRARQYQCHQHQHQQRLQLMNSWKPSGAKGVDIVQPMNEQSP
jgi:hypothetical protein